jgi:hypothetical protein
MVRDLNSSRVGQRASAPSISGGHDVGPRADLYRCPAAGHRGAQNQPTCARKATALCWRPDKVDGSNDAARSFSQMMKTVSEVDIKALRNAVPNKLDRGRCNGQ